MKFFHFKQVPYKYNQKKVVMTTKDFRALQDYILYLESFAHFSTGITFSSIPEEIAKYKQGEWYKFFRNKYNAKKEK